MDFKYPYVMSERYKTAIFHYLSTYLLPSSLEHHCSSGMENMKGCGERKWAQLSSGNISVRLLP